jgi:4-hydroxybenzoate polyprenyltransferase
MGAMFRFTIKSLIFITAVVAAYALIAISAVSSSTWRCMIGLAMALSLIASKLIYDIIKTEKDMMNERTEREKLLE